MTLKRCPTCGHTVLVTTTYGPSEIMICPCGHKIGHMAELIDAPALDPLLPGEWVTGFFAESDEN